MGPASSLLPELVLLTWLTGMNQYVHLAGTPFSCDLPRPADKDTSSLLALISACRGLGCSNSDPFDKQSSSLTLLEKLPLAAVSLSSALVDPTVGTRGKGQGLCPFFRSSCPTKTKS